MVSWRLHGEAKLFVKRFVGFTLSGPIGPDAFLKEIPSSKKTPIKDLRLQSNDPLLGSQNGEFVVPKWSLHFFAMCVICQVFFR